MIKHEKPNNNLPLIHRTGMISRRNFLLAGLGLATGIFFPGIKQSLCAAFPHFFFTQLKYRGGEWDPNPQFVEAIIEELEPVSMG